MVGRIVIEPNPPIFSAVARLVTFIFRTASASAADLSRRGRRWAWAQTRLAIRATAVGASIDNTNTAIAAVIHHIDRAAALRVPECGIVRRLT